MPNTNSQILFTSVVVIFGLVIYSVILGSATSALQVRPTPFKNH